MTAFKLLDFCLSQPQNILIAYQNIVRLHDTIKIPVCLYFICANGVTPKVGVSDASKQVPFTVVELLFSK